MSELSSVKEETTTQKTPTVELVEIDEENQQHTLSGEHADHHHQVKKKILDFEFQGFGKCKVHIYGDLEEKSKRAVFFTVHDIGTNHRSFAEFLQHPCMSEICTRSIFILVDLPGQYDDAPDLELTDFPSIQEMGEKLLPQILDALNVQLVVGIGDGAGANVLVRFALKNPERILGLILIHLVSAGVGMLEKLRDSIFSGKRRSSEAFASPESVVRLHRFGETPETPPVSPSHLIGGLNANNLRRYVEAYMNRKDLSDKMSSLRSTDILLVAGSKSQYAAGVVAIQGKMNKEKTSLLKIDNVQDILHQAPDKFAHSLLLFVKGLGYLTSVTLPGVERQRTFSGEGTAGMTGPGGQKTLGAIGRRRTLSMEEYDLPRPRRLSLTATKLN